MSVLFNLVLHRIMFTSTSFNSIELLTNKVHEWMQRCCHCRRRLYLYSVSHSTNDWTSALRLSAYNFWNNAPTQWALLSLLSSKCWCNLLAPFYFSSLNNLMSHFFFIFVFVASSKRCRLHQDRSKHEWMLRHWMMKRQWKWCISDDISRWSKGKKRQRIYTKSSDSWDMSIAMHTQSWA